MRSTKIREQAECGSREIHGGGTERGAAGAHYCLSVPSWKLHACV